MSTFSAAFATRAAAFSLAAIISLSLLGSMAHIANQQFSDVVMAQAHTAATQIAVVNGHPLPKA